MGAIALCRGPDVSNWSGYPNWAAVRAAGSVLAGAKATEGTGFRDSTFPFDWPRMSSAGLLRIAYHFAHADGSDPVAQADYFCDYVQACGGWRPWDIPCLDLEAGGLTGSALTWWTDQWCRRVEQRWGRPGLLYTGGWYFRDRGGDATAIVKRGWKLWVSAYSSSPSIFSGFHDWELWQYTDGQSNFTGGPSYCPGIGHCDMSIWNGNSDRMWAFAHWAKPQLPKCKLGSRWIGANFEGTDVAELQAALNHRLTARKKANIATDGVYGPQTETAKHYAEYILGFPDVEVAKRGCSQHAQLLIYDPTKRPLRFRLLAATRGDITPKH